MKRLCLLLSLSILLLSACTEQEIGSAKDVNPDAIFTKYSITFEEGDTEVECRARFRFGGAKGTTLVLTHPAKITFDGEEIKVDSTKPEGAYYEVSKLVSSFAAEHSWEFTGINNKKYKNTFSFAPFTLAKPIPATISKSDLVIEFSGLKDGSPIHVSMSDTSSSEDLDSVYIVTNNKLTVAAAYLKRLKNGRVRISIYQNIITPLKQATPEGGEMEITYALKRREVILKDSNAL